MTDRTHPEALRLADSLELCWGDSRLDEAAAELRRLHTENERLAALVEAQQPAPSAAAAVGEVEPVFWMNEKGHTWSHSDWKQFPKHRAKYPIPLYAHRPAPQPSPTPQADSQPAPVADGCTDPYNCKRCMTHPSHRDGMEHAGIPAHAVARAASAPADSVTAPAGGAVAEVVMAIRPPKASPAWLPHKIIHASLQWLDSVPVGTKLYATPPTQAAGRVLEDAARQERERICAAIKAEDDYCVDQGDYMLDSDDCIKIVRSEWVRPDFAVDEARKQGGAT